jgi:hypothetical protein
MIEYLETCPTLKTLYWHKYFLGLLFPSSFLIDISALWSWAHDSGPLWGSRIIVLVLEYMMPKIVCVLLSLEHLIANMWLLWILLPFDMVTNNAYEVVFSFTWRPKWLQWAEQSSWFTEDMQLKWEVSFNWFKLLKFWWYLLLHCILAYSDWYLHPINFSLLGIFFVGIRFSTFCPQFGLSVSYNSSCSLAHMQGDFSLG